MFDGLAGVAVAEGDLERALRLDGAAEALKETIGGGLPETLTGMKDVRRAVGDRVPPERIEELREEGRALGLERALRYARGEP